MLDKLMDLLIKILDAMCVFDLPSFPESVMDVFNKGVEYISNGFTVLAAFVGSDTMAYLMILLGLILTVNGLYAAYSFVMWVLRKIPFLGIKD